MFILYLSVLVAVKVAVASPEELVPAMT